ncbi:MAG: hypothetical protein F6K54_20670 [Okeania sp. SIO3B5]|uniref:hypothetical protein n=1 Tax=Okeania sp. SIO3B5 TaxID=2607811 RepID=UPI001400A9CF|nr:hypothetical protein [Okeania sp. SIO3B5]NEO55270.1 hypothetical protein [Okeania sp. SIO3B5]
MKSGNYQLKIQQTIELAEHINKETIGDRTVKFAVQGERYAIESREIHHVYPPDNSNGIFHRVLPHIVLNRTTLPWERTPNGGDKDEILSPTWMALLLFTEDDLSDIKQTNLTVDKLENPSKDPYWRDLPKELGKPKNDTATVVDVPWETLSKIIPTYSDLRMMAHIRQVQPASATTPDSEVAILMSNRLPPLNKNCTVHLVSLEQCYKPFVLAEHLDAFQTLQDHGYTILDLRNPIEIEKNLVTILQHFVDPQVQEVQLESEKPPQYLKKLDKKFKPPETSKKPEGMTDDEWIQHIVEQNCQYLLGLTSNESVNAENPLVEFDLWSDPLKCLLHVQIESITMPMEGRVVESLKGLITIAKKEYILQTAFPKGVKAGIVTEINNCFKQANVQELCLDFTKSEFVKYDRDGTTITNTASEKSLNPKLQNFILPSDQWQTEKRLPNSYYVNQKNQPFLLVFFSDNGSSEQQAGKITLNDLRVTIRRVPILPSPVEEEGKVREVPNNQLIQVWILQGMMENGAMVSTELCLDPQPRYLENDETGGVYVMAKIPFSSDINTKLQNSDIEINPTVIKNPIEAYFQPLFPEYWADRYQYKHQAMFSTIMVFKDSGNKDCVVSLEVSIEREKSDDQNLTHHSVAATLQRSTEPLMIFDIGNSIKTTPIRLLSLKQWTFYCEPQRRDFLGLLENLNRIDLSAYYQTPTTPNLSQSYDVGVGQSSLASASYREPTGLTGGTEDFKTLADSYIAAGYVPTQHYLRQGGRTVSWYRGPLVPHTEAIYSEEYPIALPARHADELFLFNPDLGLFDVSYAAAWELGRTLALANQSFAKRLYQWKRGHPGNLREMVHSIDRAYLPNRDSNHTQDVLPTDVQQWLTNLSQLKLVPFNYLIPDEALLPPESIRYFCVDPLWVECLRDGALSIGRVLSIDYRADLAHRQQLPTLPLISGVLLRSAVVSGWPHLGVTGYPENYDLLWETEEYLPNPDQPDTLKIWRLDRLAPDLLLVLFYDGAKKADGSYRNRSLRYIDFHPRPEMMHFGLEEPANAPVDYSVTNQELLKLLRTMDGEPLYIDEQGKQKVKRKINGTVCYADKNSKTTTQQNNGHSTPPYRAQVSDPIMWRQEDATTGILSLAHLSEIIADIVLDSKQGIGKDKLFTAANFALQMLDSPPLVRFKCPG